MIINESNPKQAKPQYLIERRNILSLRQLKTANSRLLKCNISFVYHAEKPAAKNPLLSLKINHMPSELFTFQKIQCYYCLFPQSALLILLY